tara:strand:+ start:53 stop:571 length:519 start_codon:yes stop_codon:yes gene_type:complete
MTLNDKLATIQTKFKSKKSRFNSFGKYNFRSAEDILEATKPFLLELGVSVTINERLIENEPFPILESTATISDTVDAIHATAIVGIDLAQKGMQMPQKFGSASSYGKKYSLGNLFLIDDTADSDAINNHDKTSKPKLAGAALTKAKAFLKAGGSLDAIKGKYEIPAELLKTL